MSLALIGVKLGDKEVSEVSVGVVILPFPLFNEHLESLQFEAVVNTASVNLACWHEQSQDTVGSVASSP